MVDLEIRNTKILKSKQIQLQSFNHYDFDFLIFSAKA